jgi:hypothetical protein
MPKKLEPPGSRQKKCLSADIFAGYSSLGEVRKSGDFKTDDTNIVKQCQISSAAEPAAENPIVSSGPLKVTECPPASKPGGISEKLSRIDSPGLSTPKGSNPPAGNQNPEAVEPGKPGGLLEVRYGGKGAPKFKRAKPVSSDVSTSENPFLYLINERKSSHRCQQRTYESHIANNESDSLGDRIERYRQAKVNTLELQKYLTIIDPYRAKKLVGCASHIWLREYLNYGQSRLKGGLFCGQPRLCQPCAIRRSSNLLRKLVEKVYYVLRTSNSPGAGSLPILPHLVTFTVKDGADLRERYDHLDSSIRFMAERARKYRNNPRNIRNEWSKAAGVYICHEFKRGEGSKLWHPHTHCLWLSEFRPNVEALRQEWFEITGDSFIVDVRPLNCAPHLYDAIKSGHWDSDKIINLLAADLKEVCKYTLKLSGMTPEDSYEAYQKLTGRHMVRTYGLLYGIDPSELLDNSEPDLDGPYLDHILQWHNDQYVSKGIRTNPQTISAAQTAIDAAAALNPVKAVKIG